MIRKIDIPKNKEKAHQDDGRKKRFPITYEIHPFFFETKKKRNHETEKIQCYVVIVLQNSNLRNRQFSLLEIL